MTRLLGLVLSLIFAAVAARASGDELTVYLHGEPFYGERVIQGRQIYLEEEALKVSFPLPPGRVIPRTLKIRRDGKRFVSLYGLARLLRASVRVNWETGIADLYTPYKGEALRGPIIVIPPSAYVKEETRIAPPVQPSFAPYYPYSPYASYVPYSPYPFFVGTPVISVPFPVSAFPSTPVVVRDFPAVVPDPMHSVILPGGIFYFPKNMGPW